MGVKAYKPTSAGRRFQVGPTFEELTRANPEKSLLRPLSKSGGRNSMGRITSRHRGGGHKRRYRLIDFKRDKHNIPAKVASIEYDPNRAAHIALLHYRDGEKRYILAPQQLSPGDTVLSGAQIDINPGNALPLKNIPVGTINHNVELKPKKGAQMIRSAGSFGQLVAKEGKYAQIKLPSNEVRMVLLECAATVGQISNPDHFNISLGKAGKTRWRGKKSKVRGVAMNPVDHPLGGGEGKSSGGRHPCTPWGKPTKGYRTRKNKSTDKFIVRRRRK